MRKWVQAHPGASVFWLLAGLFAIYEIATSFVAYTADAYVTSDVIVAAPQVAGPLKTIAVARNQQVAAGDLLFEIDPALFALKVSQLEAQRDLARTRHAKALSSAAAAGDAVTEAQAVLSDARLTYERLAKIVDSGAVTQQRVDDAKRDFDQAQAHVAELKAMAEAAARDIAVQAGEIAVAEAELAVAEYDLAQTRVTAGSAGFVAPYQAKAGDYIEVGQPVLAVITTTDWRIVANLPDYYLGVIRPGQPVLVQISTDPWRLHWATVRSVPRGISRTPEPENVLPYVTPTTEWIRLPRRFPVEIDLGDLPERYPMYSASDARIVLWADTFRRPEAVP